MYSKFLIILRYLSKINGLTVCLYNKVKPIQNLYFGLEAKTLLDKEKNNYELYYFVSKSRLLFVCSRSRYTL